MHGQPNAKTGCGQDFCLIPIGFDDTNQDGFLNSLRIHLPKYFPNHFVCLYLRNPEDLALCPVVRVPDGDAIDAATLKAGEVVAAMACARGAPIVMSGPENFPKKRKHGREAKIRSLAAFPVSGEDGEPQGALVAMDTGLVFAGDTAMLLGLWAQTISSTLRTVALRRALESERRRLRENLKGLDFAIPETIGFISEYASGMTHDICHILTYVGVRADRLAQICGKSETSEHLGAVHHGLRTVSQLLRNMLMGLGTRRINPTLRDYCDLTSTTEETIQFLRGGVPPHIRITHCVPQTRCLVPMEPVQVSQIILNLVTNAVEAIGSKSGLIDVTVIKDPKRLEAMLVVSDDGPGISPEVRERLTDFRVTTKKHGGGIGLAMVKSLVHAAGGTLIIEDGDPGAVFTVRLPLCLENDGMQRRQDQKDSAATLETGPRVLIVDDDSSLTEIFGDVLREEGYLVDTINNPREALRLLGQKTYDVLISDQSMPFMTGTEILMTMRRQNIMIPVILLTGLDTVDLLDAKMLGATIMTKPVSSQDLRRAVEKLLKSQIYTANSNFLNL